MSDFADMASAIGIPAGGISASIAFYAGCVAAEKEARPQALRDIGVFIFSDHAIRTVKAPKIVRNIFESTFGRRHFSFRCVFISACASLLVFTVLVLQFSISTDIWPDIDLRYDSGLVFTSLFIAIVIDYIALLKSRLLIIYSQNKRSSVIIIGIIDIITSAYLAGVGIDLIVWGIGGVWRVMDSFPGISSFSLHMMQEILLHKAKRFPYVGAFAVMPMLSSIWLILLAVSTLLLSVAAPAQRAIAWFFPVEEHPIRAIGIVAAGLILITSFAWALIRPLFA